VVGVLSAKPGKVELSIRNSANNEKLFEVNLISTYALGHPNIKKKNQNSQR
jgi:hypothetical protein